MKLAGTSHTDLLRSAGCGLQTRLESVAAEVFMNAEERERVQQICALIQNEKEQGKLTDLMQELLALLENNGRRSSADGEKENRPV